MKKNTFGTFTIITILIVGIAVYLSWQVIIPEYKSNKLALAETNAEINSAKNKLDSLKTARASITSLGDLVSEAFVAVPEGSDAPNLITELEAIATKNQTYIPSIQINDSSSTSASSTVTTISDNSILVSFSVNGSLDNLEKFLADIESDIRFMNIKSVSITSSSDMFSLALQIESYKRENSSLVETVTPATTAPAATIPGGE